VPVAEQGELVLNERVIEDGEVREVGRRHPSNMRADGGGEKEGSSAVPRAVLGLDSERDRVADALGHAAYAGAEGPLDVWVAAAEQGGGGDGEVGRVGGERRGIEAEHGAVLQLERGLETGAHLEVGRGDQGEPGVGADGRGLQAEGGWRRGRFVTSPR
jgi:hypothetical protein